MITLVGCIATFDLRLLGLLLRRDRVSDLAKRLLPWTWVGFTTQVITGTLLFASEANKLYPNPAFRLKLLLIVFAGANALIFHWTTFRKASSWEVQGTLPIGAKLAGSISLLLWLSVVAAGRFIGFV